MSNDEQPDKKRKLGKFGLAIQIATLVATLAAVSASIVLSYLAEKDKALGLHYISIRPLISLDAKRSENLKVTYASQEVTRLGLLSARLENIGNLPIESGDIDQPLSLFFRNAKVLSVEITSLNPPDIEVTTSYKNQTAKIVHKLLNAGDSIGFDILFDGEAELPEESIRISGVVGIKKFYPTGRGPVVYTTLISLPLPIAYLLLSFITLVSAGVLFFGIFQSWFYVTPLFRRNRSISPDEMERKIEEIKPENIGIYKIELAEFTEDARIILSYLNERPNLGWVQSPDGLAAKIKQAVPSRTLSALGLEPIDATELILKKLRSETGDAVFRSLYHQMPEVIFKAAEDKLRELNLDNQNIDQLLSEIHEVFRAVAAEPLIEKFWIEGRGEGIAQGLVAVVIGFSAIVFLGATWRTMLAI